MKEFMQANNVQIIMTLIPIIFILARTLGVLALIARIISLEKEAHLKHQLSLQKQMLMYQHKMSSVGKMVATISHQLKQPLASIHGILANLGSDFDNKKLSEQRLNHYLDQAEDLSFYMSDTIQDFSDYLSPDNKQKFSITYVIKKSIALSESAIKKGHIKLNVETDKEADNAYYPSVLIQVIIILIQNACDALIRNNSENKTINIQHYSKNNHHYIIVKDNGGGISIEQKEKIFQSYFTSNHLSKSRGLGLYIAKTLIEDSLKGQISVTNDKQGAVFTISL